MMLDMVLAEAACHGVTASKLMAKNSEERRASDQRGLRQERGILERADSGSLQ